MKSISMCSPPDGWPRAKCASQQRMGPSNSAKHSAAAHWVKTPAGRLAAKRNGSGSPHAGSGTARPAGGRSGPGKVGRNGNCSGDNIMKNWLALTKCHCHFVCRNLANLPPSKLGSKVSWSMLALCRDQRRPELEENVLKGNWLHKQLKTLPWSQLLSIHA